MKSIRINNIVYLVLIVPILLVLLTGCHKEQLNSSQIPPKVTVSRPLQKEVTSCIKLSGVTEAFKSVRIQARTEGLLENIHFKSGTVVNKDDLLFSIEPKLYEAKVQEAETLLIIRKAELKVAKKTMTRFEEAYKKNAVSEITVIEAERKLVISEALVVAAKAALDIEQLNLSYTKIKAPISGVVARSLVDVGNLVGGNEQTVLTSIVQTDPIYAYFRVSEEDYEKIINIQIDNQNNMIPVFIGLLGESDYPFQGIIDYIDNSVDIETGTIQIRAVFPNPEKYLLSGSFVRIKIPIEKPNKKLLIPDKAFGLDQQGKYLLVVDTDNKVSYQPVTIGELIDGMRVVTEGLSSNDVVIINGMQKAIPGFEITPQE